jgi:hypothetical protein
MAKPYNFHSIFLHISDVIFVILLLVLAYIYDFNHVLFLEPQSVHMWRQSDCLSFALNYSKENRGFFEPAINFVGVSGNGQTISDFPLLYYIVGKIWQITGQHEFVFRGLVLSIFFTALFFLYRTLVKLFDDRLWAMLIPLMMFTSPVLSYYSSSFLMEIPALSIAIIGWYFFYKYYQTSQNKWLWITMLVFTVAGLLKVSSMLSYFALLGLFLIEWLKLFTFRKDRPVFPEPRKAIFPFLIVLSTIAAWFTFVTHYNNTHNRDFFLVGILPIWEMTAAEIQEKFHAISTHWIFHNFPGYFQVIVVAFWATMLVLPKKNNRIFYYLNLVLAVGVVMYLLLFFQVVAGHDYYWINLYILLLLTTVSFVYFLKNNLQFAFKWGKIAFVVLLVFNVIYTHKKIDERYHGAYMEYYNLYMKDLSSMKEYNRKLGIQRDDLVISIPDGTINASLYLMDQKGWSTYGSNFETQEFYRNYISRGAKYLFVSDTALLRKDYLKPFIKNKIGDYKSVSVFDLKGLN